MCMALYYGLRMKEQRLSEGSHGFKSQRSQSLAGWPLWASFLTPSSSNLWSGESTAILVWELNEVMQNEVTDCKIRVLNLIASFLTASVEVVILWQQKLVPLTHKLAVLLVCFWLKKRRVSKSKLFLAQVVWVTTNTQVPQILQWHMPRTSPRYFLINLSMPDLWRFLFQPVFNKHWWDRPGAGL